MPDKTESMLPRRRAALQCLAGAATSLLLPGCGGGGGTPAPATQPPAVAAGNPSLRVTTLNAGLSSPWGMASLPDGRLLVTQKAGSMLLVLADGSSLSAPLRGLPGVASAGQGGLLDVVLDPDFATDPWVYWSYARRCPPWRGDACRAAAWSTWR
jgi:aldose sugar dehydrogenase